MEFSIKTLIIIILAVIALMVFVALLSQSASTGSSLIDSLFNFFGEILPQGDGGTIPEGGGNRPSILPQ